MAQAGEMARRGPGADFVVRFDRSVLGEGVAVNEATKEPLRRVEISLYSSGKNGVMMGSGNSAFSAVTDAAGSRVVHNEMEKPGARLTVHRMEGPRILQVHVKRVG